MTEQWEKTKAERDALAQQLQDPSNVHTQKVFTNCMCVCGVMSTKLKTTSCVMFTMPSFRTNPIK